jgi:hypothetical protein
MQENGKSKCSWFKAENCDRGFKAPGVVFAFNIFGWIGTVAGFVMLIIAALGRDGLMMLPAVSLFVGGLLYLAAAVIVDSTSETAWNTRELLRIKEFEAARCMEQHHADHQK